MSFTDTLKRSLGFEETESTEKKDGEGFNLSEFINSFKSGREEQLDTAQQYQQNNTATQDSVGETQTYDDYDDYVIIPEQSFYEIILIRPKTIDDINYVVDQIIEEKNPVILDLSFLERESATNFKIAGQKIKQMKERYGVQALLLAKTDDKDLIIVSPKKVRVINKG